MWCARHAAANDYSTGRRAITDLELRYQPTDTALNLAIGANNLFDVYPRSTPPRQHDGPAPSRPIRPGV
jgi:outer membrane receptor protein involved in Fe transport